MRILIFLFVLCPALALAQTDTLTRVVLTPDESKEDFNYYRRLLQETHPGLYRYTSEERMQSKLDSIDQLLDKPLAFYEFYKIMTALVSDIRCAHTTALPTSDFRKYLNNIKTLPLFLYPIQDRLYVIFNGTTDPNITLGYELVEINGHCVDSVSSILKRHYWADGYAEPSKNTVLLGGVFCLFYYSIIERPGAFRLRFKDLSGKEYAVTVPAQLYAETEKLYKKSSTNKKAREFYNKKYKSPWRLSFLSDLKSTAVLRFDGFGGKGMNSGDQARLGMQKFMDKSLDKIEKKECRYLIVDVRSNSGGWDTQGIELFTYLMKQDTPVRYYQRQHAIVDSSEFLAFSDLSEEDRRNVKEELKMEADGTFSLVEEKNPDLKLQYPKPNRFKGNVYFLMNERSYSTTSEFLAVCKSNKVGIMVGEEAGGAYEGGNGSSFIHLTLPNSKIHVGTPLVYYQNAVQPVQQKGRGTMPDYRVVIQPEDIITDYGREMEFVKEMIRKVEREN